MAIPRVTLAPMGEAELAVYLELAIPAYAEANVRAGYWPEDEALEKSREAYDRLLPDGLGSEGQLLFTAVDAENAERVGILWIGMRQQANGLQAYVYDVAVHEELRGKGYGHAVMNACADKARELGAASVGLHVFTYNEPAYQLYQNLGYKPTSLNMVLPL